MLPLLPLPLLLKSLIVRFKCARKFRVGLFGDTAAAPAAAAAAAAEVTAVLAVVKVGLRCIWAILEKLSCAVVFP